MKTKEQILEQIVKKQDELIEWLDSDLESGDALIRLQLSILKKQLEECEEDKYCICSYPRPHTYGGGTKQLCITCNKWINTKINE